MARKLTRQQELYKDSRLKGLGQKQSYQIAYPKSLKWNDNSIRVEANALEHNPIISISIEEARLKAKEKTEGLLLWSKEDSIRILKEICERGADSADRDKINSVKELNQMHGFNEPIKMDANLKSDAELTINIVQAKAIESIDNIIEHE